MSGGGKHWLDGASVEPVGDFDLFEVWNDDGTPNHARAAQAVRAGKIRVRSLTLPDATVLVLGMSDQVATSIEIVYAFMEHTGRTSLDSGWPVNEETYINNVVMTIDADYLMGYLLECVDRTSGAMTFVAVALYHGRRKDGYFDHDFITFITHEPNCGTFFERTEAAEPTVVGRWAVSVIYGMFDTYHEELERKGRRVPA